MTRFLASLVLAAVALTGAGCDGFSDFVDDPLGDFALSVRLTDEPVALGTEGVSVAVRPGVPTVAEGSVPVDVDFGTIETIEELRIDAEDITFTPDPVTTGRGSAAASGSFDLTYQLGSGPTVTETIEIVDGVVTTSIVVPASVIAVAIELINSGLITYRYEISNVVSDDPAQPLAGTLSVAGYTGTFVVTETSGGTP